MLSMWNVVESIGLGYATQTATLTIDKCELVASLSFKFDFV
jgi:hypothetical protein